MKPRVEFHQDLPPARCGSPVRVSRAVRPASIRWGPLARAGSRAAVPFHVQQRRQQGHALLFFRGRLFLHQPCRQHTIDKSGVQPPRHKIRVLQHAAEEGDIRADALNLVFTQSPPQPRDGLRAVPHPTRRVSRAAGRIPAALASLHTPRCRSRMPGPAGTCNRVMSPGEGKKLLAGSSA